jgi:hypothetical protein
MAALVDRLDLFVAGERALQPVFIIPHDRGRTHHAASVYAEAKISLNWR